MRTEQEMFELIHRVAYCDERVQMVFLNGSRANPNIQRDEYQDFDIVYFVTSLIDYINHPQWIDVFGSRVILQIPENNENHITYLMQFTDGNRIDLTLMTLTSLSSYLLKDTQTILLWNKTDIDIFLPKPTDQSHWVKKPSYDEFISCINEFHWVSLYVAKGINRNELTYAMEHLNQILRPEYMKMISWAIASRYKFQINLGKNLKFIKNYIQEKEMKTLLDTYCIAKASSIWKSLLLMFDSFSSYCDEVSKYFHYQIHLEEQKKTKDYLIYLKNRRTKHD